MSEKQFEGVDIREVWNFRLSTAVPTIHREGGTWVVHIHSKVDGGEPLESHDTGIEAVSGDQFNKDNLIACYKWLYSVRDKYALEDIEERKPHVAQIEEVNKILAQMGAK